jgi:hypothetical protein
MLGLIECSGFWNIQAYNHFTAASMPWLWHGPTMRTWSITFEGAWGVIQTEPFRWRLNIGTSHCQSGRQKAWTVACVKRKNRLSTVSVRGKRSVPGMEWRALSERNHSQCAKRLAPATTEHRNTMRGWAGGMEFCDVCENGMVSLSFGPGPIL